MDAPEPGPSRLQPVLRLRDPDLELDLPTLSALFPSAHYDDEKLSGTAIVNQEVNGIFDDLDELKELLVSMKAWESKQVMEGFESAYTAVDHVTSRVKMIMCVLEEEVADALRRSLRGLRDEILALEENLDDQSDKMFVIDLIAALPDIGDPASPADGSAVEGVQTLLIVAWIYPRQMEERGKGKGKARELKGDGEEEG